MNRTLPMAAIATRMPYVSLYSVVIIMVLITTLITPPSLKWAIER
jgi:hypothetical protein